MWTVNFASRHPYLHQPEALEVEELLERVAFRRHADRVLKKSQHHLRDNRSVLGPFFAKCTIVPTQRDDIDIGGLDRVDHLFSAAVPRCLSISRHILMDRMMKRSMMKRSNTFQSGRCNG